MSKIELKIVRYLNRLGSDSKVLTYITKLVGGRMFLIIMWATFGITFLFMDKIYGIDIFFDLAVALSLYFIINEGILKYLLSKFNYCRLRPYLAHQEIIPIGTKFTDSSFPSSHVTSTMAVMTVLFTYYPNLWIIMAVFLVFMAFERMHSGMHYLSDVAAGTLLGACYGLIASSIVYFLL